MKNEQVIQFLEFSNEILVNLFLEIKSANSENVVNFNSFKFNQKSSDWPGFFDVLIDDLFHLQASEPILQLSLEEHKLLLAILLSIIRYDMKEVQPLLLFDFHSRSHSNHSFFQTLLPLNYGVDGSDLEISGTVSANRAKYVFFFYIFELL